MMSLTCGVVPGPACAPGRPIARISPANWLAISAPSLRPSAACSGVCEVVSTSGSPTSLESGGKSEAEATSVSDEQMRIQPNAVRAGALPDEKIEFEL